jgi:hypothetical protein
MQHIVVKVNILLTAMQQQLFWLDPVQTLLIFNQQVLVKLMLVIGHQVVANQLESVVDLHVNNPNQQMLTNIVIVKNDIFIMK